MPEFRWLFAPAVTLMDRLSYVKKFTIISLLFFLPILALSYVVVADVFRQRFENRLEYRGFEVLQHVVNLYRELAYYRDLNTSWIIGRAKPVAAMLAEQKNKVTAALDAFNSLALEGPAFAKVSKQLEATRSAWQEHLQVTETSRWPMVQYTADSAPVNAAVILLRILARETGLNRDNATEISLLSEMLVREFADLAEAMSAVRMLGFTIASDGYLSVTTKEAAGVVLPPLEKVSRDFESAAAAVVASDFSDPELLVGLTAASTAAKAFYTHMQEKIIATRGTNLKVEQFAADAEIFFRDYFTFHQLASMHIETALQEKAEHYRNLLMLLSASLLLLGLLIAYLYTGFYRSIKRIINRFIDAVAAVAAGDMTARIKTSNTDEMGILTREFNKMVEKMHALIAAAANSAAAVSDQAERVQNIAVDNQKTIVRQRTEIGSVADAIRVMHDTVQEVVGNAAQAAHSAQQANTDAEQGQSQVDRALSQITELAKNIESSVQLTSRMTTDSSNISQVLIVIKGIAEQTNLLALNAAIEAARAGEQGRGFAVVADEVRSLAAKTRDSTAEIEQMISHLQEGVHQAVDFMQRSRDMAQLTVEQSRAVGEVLLRITRAVSDIHSMNQKIANVVEQQNRVARTVDETIVAINAGSEIAAKSGSETQQASQQMATAALSLNEMIGSFRL